MSESTFSSRAMAGLFTPSKLTASWPRAKLQDSPFSDYFTDEGRSTRGDDCDNDSAGNERFSNSPSEPRGVLTRLARLQIKLKNDGCADRQFLRLVEQKLNELENLPELPQTRVPPEMEDSGLFMDEGEGEETNDGAVFEDRDDGTTSDQRRAEADFLLLEAQRGLASVSKAQERLRQCHHELRSMHSAYDTLLDEHEARVSEMRQENESLRSDIALDYEDLASLQVHFAAVERELGRFYIDSAEAASIGFPECRGTASPPRPARSRIRQHMDGWRSAWSEVCLRARQRRRKQISRANFDVRQELRERPSKESLDLFLDEVELEQEAAPRTSSTPSVEKSPPTIGYSHKATQTEMAVETNTETACYDIAQVDFAKSNKLKSGAADEFEQCAYDDDCAVTSSSEMDEDDYRDDESSVEGSSEIEDDLSASQSTSAWQDLWKGLTIFVGMGDERFDTLAEYAVD